MLTDLKLKGLKPAEKRYKVSDRDGLHVVVYPSGGISFRYSYRINNRQETVVLGKYGPGNGGLTLAEAREKLAEARKRVEEGKSPHRAKALLKAENRNNSFEYWAGRYFSEFKMAESTRDMRQAVYDRDLRQTFGKLTMTEITHMELRNLCDKILKRGARATAVHVREITMAIFNFAIDRGMEVTNPADRVRPSTIATFEPKDRALSRDEIRSLWNNVEKIQANPVLKLAVKLLLLTMTRKTELAHAEWSEFHFTEAKWVIPEERMKARKPHTVYLSHQAIEILLAMKTCAGGSKFVLPSRYDPGMPISQATLNRVTTEVVKYSKEVGDELEHFGPHDLRRTASTHLHEAGYNSDWIEKCLAHEQRGIRAVYNKAEYEEQRRAMLQDWADMVERWASQETSRQREAAFHASVQAAGGATDFALRRLSSQLRTS